MHYFHRRVSRYRGNHKVKRFTCRGPFPCMAFAQQTYRGLSPGSKKPKRTIWAQEAALLALMVMLAYMLVRDLKRVWKDFDLTVEEGLGELNRICAIEVSVAGTDAILRLSEPSSVAKLLLKALQVNLPPARPRSKVVVDTKRKLPSRRKNV